MLNTCFKNSACILSLTISCLATNVLAVGSSEDEPLERGSVARGGPSASAAEEQNPKAIALRTYIDGAALGKSWGMVGAARLLKDGFPGQLPNPSDAFQYCLRAIELDDKEAMIIAGELLENGFDGHPPDVPAAIDYYIRSNDPDSMFHGGTLLENGFGGHPPDRDRALRVYQFAAETGHVGSMLRAAFLFENGFEGQRSNQRRAIEFYHLASDKDMASSSPLIPNETLFHFAEILENSTDNTSSYKIEAFSIYERLSGRGHREAMFRLGLMYKSQSDGNAKNKRLALKYFEKAAGLGHEEAGAEARRMRGEDSGCSIQ